MFDRKKQPDVRTFAEFKALNPQNKAVVLMMLDKVEALRIKSDKLYTANKKVIDEVIELEAHLEEFKKQIAAILMGEGLAQ